MFSLSLMQRSMQLPWATIFHVVTQQSRRFKFMASQSQPEVLLVVTAGEGTTGKLHTGFSVLARK